MTDVSPAVGLNYLSKNRAVLQIPGIENASFTLTQFNIPGISLPPVEVPSPYSQKKYAGDKVMYDTLVFTFQVDDHLTNFIEIFNWIIRLGAPQNKQEQYDGTELDAFITIYSAKNNPIIKLHFIELVPTSLQGIDFDESIDETTPLSVTVQCEYRYYIFVNPNTVPE